MPWMYRNERAEVRRNIGRGSILFVLSLVVIIFLGSYLPQIENQVLGNILVGLIFGLIILGLYGLARLLKGIAVWIRHLVR